MYGSFKNTTPKENIQMESHFREDLKKYTVFSQKYAYVIMFIR